MILYEYVGIDVSGEGSRLGADTAGVDCVATNKGIEVGVDVVEGVTSKEGSTDSCGAHAVIVDAANM